MFMRTVARLVGRGVIDAVRARWRGLSHVNVGVSVENGHLDRVDIEPSGRVRLMGWSEGGAPPDFRVAVNGRNAPRVRWFEVHRPDLRGSQKGYCVEFAGPQEGIARRVTVGLNERELAHLEPLLPLQPPHYASLLDEDRVLHREEIYGVGPPTELASPEVVALARHLPGPMLDFGCGSGALIRELRGSGIQSVGIELRRPEIEASLRDDVRPAITLYDGKFPLPFADGQFETVICSEVLEHIPDYSQAAKEMARVGRRALITVPDVSAIPALFPHSVVPWHLLEATHVNFFTQVSLERLLQQFFSRISFSRIGAFQVNGTQVFTSLVARCER